MLIQHHDAHCKPLVANSGTDPLAVAPDHENRFRFWIADWCRNRFDLSLEEEGLLFTACMCMIETRAPLPSDEKQAARLINTSPRRYARVMTTLLAKGKLLRGPNGIFSPVVTKELDRIDREWRARSRNGFVREARAFIERGGVRTKRTSIPIPTKLEVLEKTSGRCVYCAVVLILEDGHSNSYRPDHVLPVARGGTNDIANLVPSCRACNAKKSDKTALQFMSYGEVDHET